MRRILLVVAFAAVGAACSVRDTLPAPTCGPDSSIIIVAQSVPTASYVPCLDELPAGWMVSTVEVNQDHSVVTLDSDRAGQSAATLRFERTCAIGAVAPTDRPDIARRLVVDRSASSFSAQSYYGFPGGCVTLLFDFDRGAPAAESRALAESLVLLSREELNEDIRQFVGEDV